MNKNRSTLFTNSDHIKQHAIVYDNLGYLYYWWHSYIIEKDYKRYENSSK